MKFLALNAYFCSPSPDPLGSRTPAHVSVKEGYPLKSVYFIDISSSSMKKVAVGTDILLIITSTSHELFSGVNIDDLE